MPSSRGSSWSWDQTCNSCLLHWQAGSLPLVTPGKLFCFIYFDNLQVNIWLGLLYLLEELIPLSAEGSNFRDSGRRNKTLESEIKLFIIHNTGSSINSSFLLTLVNARQSVNSGRCCTHSGFVLSWETLTLGNPNPLKKAARRPAQHFPWRTLSLLS